MLYSLGLAVKFQEPTQSRALSLQGFPGKDAVLGVGGSQSGIFGIVLLRYTKWYKYLENSHL